YWSGDPDPDFIMSVYTAGQCLGWSDGCYSDPKFDEMYEQQRATADPGERKALIDEMQRYIYEQVPVVVLAYPSVLEAYRTDRFTGWVTAPGDQGPVVFGYGNWSYLDVKPVTGATSAPSSGGGPPVFVWLGLGAVLLIVVGASVARRRSEKREG
ncbi:MAG: ABC transporter substrate-binding protein, partial [Actinobacteria bacterium]|nr:ABC transporter substrate-binding protein [Actinomycetota bacterium]